MIEYKGPHQEAEDARKQYRRYSREYRKDCRRAAEFYRVAANELDFARWLIRTGRMWDDFGTPAEHEAAARTYVRLGDLYLRSSAHTYSMNTFYRGLFKHYRERAREQDARLAERSA